MARVMSASGFLKPKATRVIGLILVFSLIWSDRREEALNVGRWVVDM